jgi:hypothetical protein
MISETTSGLAAEYIAAASILELGWRVSLAQQDRVDLVAWKDGQFLRIQVKGSNLRYNKGHSAGYHFQLGCGSKKKTLPSKDDYDVIALVAIPARRVLFFPVETVQQYTKRATPRRFEYPDIEADSWNKTLEMINGRLG